MTRLLSILAMAVILAFPAIGCFAPAEPTPTATATPDVGAMVRAAIASALDGTATPVPTPTATPTLRPTATTTTTEPNRLVSILHMTPAPTSRPAATPAKLHSGPTIAELVARLRPSLAKIQTQTSHGSGFVYQENGLVATNAHVVDCCSTVKVSVNNRSYSGTVLGMDGDADVAVVRINSSRRFQSAQLADANRVAVGDEVLALGFPLNLGNDPTVTRGIVSSRRSLNGHDYFQHDASINPGNSGGPLINLDGFVIGMNTWKRFDAEGVGFALSANEIDQRLHSLATGSPSATPHPGPTATPQPWPTSTPVPTMQPEPTRKPDTPFKRVSAGWIHSCGLTDENSIVCWGGSAGATPPIGKFQQVSVGKINTCGIRDDGRVVCWVGQNILASPLAGQFQQLYAGYDFNCGVKIDRTVHCWSNDQSQEIASPDGEFRQVSSGSEYSCGIKTNGRISCWDKDGDWFTELPTGTLLPTGTFLQISAGLYHFCGVRDDGSAACWSDPVLRCGIKSDGTPGCWDGDEYGQSTTPHGNFQSVSAGSHHSCGVKTNRKVVCWGNDEHGQASAPPGDFKSVSAGRWHTCGVKIDGSVECWGGNRYGQATPPK